MLSPLNFSGEPTEPLGFYLGILLVFGPDRFIKIDAEGTTLPQHVPLQSLKVSLMAESATPMLKVLVCSWCKCITFLLVCGISPSGFVRGALSDLQGSMLSLPGSSGEPIIPYI